MQGEKDFNLSKKSIEFLIFGYKNYLLITFSVKCSQVIIYFIKKQKNHTLDFQFISFYKVFIALYFFYKLKIFILHFLVFIHHSKLIKVEEARVEICLDYKLLFQNSIVIKAQIIVLFNAKYQDNF